MLTFIMNLLAGMFEKPVNAGPCKEYRYEVFYYDDYENEIFIKTNRPYDLSRQEDAIFDSYLFDLEEAEAMS